MAYNFEHGSLALNKGITLAILSLSGKIPVIKDELRAYNNASQIYSKDALIIDMGKLSSPGALPSLKHFIISSSSFIRTGLKFGWDEVETGRDFR